MNNFSIIIPVKPNGYAAACEHLMTLMLNEPSCEIILAEGSSPSRQRNLAAEEANGDILYFLDDDSLISPMNFGLIIEGMKDQKVAVVGGPSLTPAGDGWLQQLFGNALSSAFGSGAVINRYRSHGKPRLTTDKELILCNLAVRRQVFKALGGFNEDLYPNEENEFLERVNAAGYKLLHVPAMYIQRSQRRTLKAFVRQIFNYGRGRGEQTLITHSYSVTSFIPLLFIVYLVFALILIKYVLLLAPLVVYLCAALVSSFQVFIRTGRAYSLLLTGVFPLMHVVNGIGLLWGLINGKPKSVIDSTIQIRTIKSFGANVTE